MTTTRPITRQQREAAREYVEKMAPRIRNAMGFVLNRRFDLPQPQWGIHEITGMRLKWQSAPASVPGARIEVETIGLVSGLIADEFLARYRYEQPLVSTVTWNYMPAQLQTMLMAGSIFPVEWKGELENGYLDDRVRVSAIAPILRFLTA